MSAFGIPPFAVLALALAAAGLLAWKMLATRRLYAAHIGRRHRWLFILGAVIVRLYVAGVYLIFIVGGVDAETRSLMGRMVVTLWLGYEVFSNLVQRAMGRGE